MTYRYSKIEDNEGLDGGDRYEIEEVCGFVTCIVDDEDTARLFCAAPDLLSELAQLANEAERRAGVPKSFITRARAVIAKATGGAA